MIVDGETLPDYPKMVVRPPGPKAREIVKRDSVAISQSYTRYYPLVIDSGQNCIVKDVDGNEYIDFNSGLACLNVGHNHPQIVKAIKKSMRQVSSLRKHRLLLSTKC